MRFDWGPMLRQFADVMLGAPSPFADDRLGLEASRRQAHNAARAEIDDMFPELGDAVADDPECE